MTPAAQKAYQWFKEHGGSAAHARNKSGGYYWLAQGETAPFSPAVVKQIVDAGKAVYTRSEGGKITRIILL